MLVCSFHHRLIHDHAYLVRRLPDRWQFLRPDGTPIPAVPVPLTGRAERLTESHAQGRLQIDQNSLTPSWCGERLDPDPILAALLPRRSSTAA